MRSIVDGRSNQLLADLPGLSIRTVEAQRAHVTAEMLTQSLSSLVCMAIAVGVATVTRR